MYRRYDFSNLGENETLRLRVHPLNDKIYGGSLPDKELQKSVAENGIFNPIVINRDKEILSGTRRWLAAKKAGFKKVPVLTLLSEGATGLLAEQFLIESNRARVKTEGMKVREVAELLRIEAELAKERLGTNQYRSKAISPDSTSGQSADIVGEKVGWGRKKVEQAAVVANSKRAMASVDAGESVYSAYRKLRKKTPEKISEGAAQAEELTKLFKNGEVTRSKKDDRFHLLLRDLTEKEVRAAAKQW